MLKLRIILVGLLFLSPTGAIAQINEVIVDNQDENVSKIGAWGVSSGPSPYLGESLYSGNRDSIYVWRPQLPQPGEYDVYAWWTYHRNRSREVPYRISDGQSMDATVIVDQRDPALGGGWNWLGRFNFADGTIPRVVVSGANGQASADAVKFARVGESPPQPGDILGFYLAPKVEKIVAPGSWGSVRSTCDSGDYAVSGSWAAGDPSEVNPPEFRFRIDHVGIIIGFSNGNQSWQLGGFNYSPPPLTAQIRVQATCADVAD
jgi:hypothetical protein